MEQDKNYLEAGLPVTPGIKRELGIAATWAKVLAIISLAGSLISFAQVLKLGQNFFSQLISLAISIVLFIFLIRFGMKTKDALQHEDDAKLADGFTDLKTYFQVYGILMIIVISLVVLVAVFVGAVASTRL
jgi:hypothetical protein